MHAHFLCITAKHRTPPPSVPADIKVNEVTPALFARGPDAQAMSGLEVGGPAGKAGWWRRTGSAYVLDPHRQCTMRNWACNVVADLHHLVRHTLATHIESKQVLSRPAAQNEPILPFLFIGPVSLLPIIVSACKCHVASIHGQVSDIQEMIRTLGLAPTKAKNVSATSKVRQAVGHLPVCYRRKTPPCGASACAPGHGSRGAPACRSAAFKAQGTAGSRCVQAHATYRRSRRPLLRSCSSSGTWARCRRRSRSWRPSLESATRRPASS